MTAVRLNVVIFVMSLACTLLHIAHAQPWWDDEISLEDLVDSGFNKEVSKRGEEESVVNSDDSGSDSSKVSKSGSDDNEGDDTSSDDNSSMNNEHNDDDTEEIDSSSRQKAWTRTTTGTTTKYVDHTTSTPDDDESNTPGRRRDTTPTYHVTSSPSYFSTTPYQITYPPDEVIIRLNKGQSTARPGTTPSTTGPTTSLPTTKKEKPVFRCAREIDIILVVHGSDTITSQNFTDIKCGVVNFIESMTSLRYPERSRIGFVQYSDKNHLIKYNLSAKKEGLKVFVYDTNTMGTGTRTDQGLLEMNRMFASNVRPGVPRVGIIVTYGLSPSPVNTAQQAFLARWVGINLFVVGITDEVRNYELVAMTGSGGRHHIYMLQHFKEFKDFVENELVYDVCAVPIKTTPRPFTTTTPENIYPTTVYTRRPVQTTTLQTTTTPMPITTPPPTNPTTRRLVYITPIPTSSTREITTTHRPTARTTRKPRTPTPPPPTWIWRPKVTTRRPTTRKPPFWFWRPKTTTSRPTTTPTRPPPPTWFWRPETTTTRPTTTTTRPQPPTWVWRPKVTTRRPTTRKPPFWFWRPKTTTSRPTATPPKVITKKPEVTTTRPFQMTTRSFTTTTWVLETPPPGFNPCLGCKMVNGAGFNPHPSDCSKFVHCIFSKSHTDGVRAVYRKCPLGHFWNQEKLTCDFSFRVDCVHDLCHNHRIKDYGNSAHCQAFWRCDKGRAFPRCCPMHHAYRGGRCVYDPSCAPTCMLSTEASPTVRRDVNESFSPTMRSVTDVEMREDWRNDTMSCRQVCKSRAIPGNPTFYEQRVSGNRWIKMPCAPGTTYYSKECKCSRLTSGSSKVAKEEGCIPEVALNFNNGLKDSSGNHVWVTNKGVKVANSSAIFKGNSELLIQRFTNDDFGKTLVIRLRYKEFSDNPRKKYALISNGDCGSDGSLVVASESSRIRFGLKTDRVKEMINVWLPKPKTEWKTVELKFEGGKLQGRANDMVFTKKVPGSIERRSCAVQIGHGWGLENFVGEMDEVSIYKCRPNSLYRG